VGYRWFDAQKIEPLFPFGYGLSYTKFAYSDMKAVADGDGGATVTVRVKNTGAVAGDEVPQVYLDAPGSAIAGVQFAPQTLVAFDRLELAAGETKTVTLHVARRAFEYWSVDKNAWVKPAGERTLHVGASSRDLRLKAEVR
jgi:beta-glucosidase